MCTAERLQKMKKLAACRISADGRLVLAHRGERVHGFLGSCTKVTAASQHAKRGSAVKVLERLNGEGR
jgi:hypothetical protein